MNKLQQEILEIIEPYMDKTLSDHCYIKIKYTEQIWVYIEESDEIFCRNNWVFGEKVSDVTNNDEYTEYYKDNVFKILWHYDVTAVLKYIAQHITDFEYANDWDLIIFTIWLGDTRYIPNKPLHLYSESENKDLLELFKKLWKNQ